MFGHPLFEVLDAAHVNYAVRETPRGVAYAGFNWLADPNHDELHLTAILDQQVLRITAHDLPPPRDERNAVLQGGPLALGALYQSPDTGLYEYSLAFFVGAAALTTTQVFLLLAYIDSASEALKHPIDSVLARPHLFDAANSEGRDIAPTLQALGHQTRSMTRGVEFDLTLNSAPPCRLQLWEAEDGWFGARIAYVPDMRIAIDDQQWQVFQRLQRWTRAGHFRISNEGVFTAEVYTPKLGQASPELVRWTASQAAAMLEVAAQHYQFS